MVATYEQIHEAIRRVEAGESKVAVVRSYPVTKTTLFHYIKMMKTTGTVERQKRGPKQLLPPGIDEDFVEWIAAMQRQLKSPLAKMFSPYRRGTPARKESVCQRTTSGSRWQACMPLPPFLTSAKKLPLQTDTSARAGPAIQVEAEMAGQLTQDCIDEDFRTSRTSDTSRS
ncbi:hypothetical protein H257_11188 [Aphanomyces astaci]|uniref:Uncharacterized protein n=1 Tax=Aphanomyces astaci TaxID=112090 RepID=W4G5D9_APHAT|nr:hypothetical protein H257_11188 [Aphanomyces astaci]ETV74254.1 hypothetical protein H257_11188 [Aphanomyces astaci]|eukprot:XP_009836360.1 hypothetical protein H257_11188 [Aphanomyces astaci]